MHQIGNIADQLTLPQALLLTQLAGDGAEVEVWAGGELIRVCGASVGSRLSLEACGFEEHPCDSIAVCESHWVLRHPGSQMMMVTKARIPPASMMSEGTMALVTDTNELMVVVAKAWVHAV